MNRTYKELCHDKTASPLERETALLKEWNHSLRQIEWLWDNCSIVFLPKNGTAPLQHNAAYKLNREAIEAYMPKQKDAQ